MLILGTHPNFPELTKIVTTSMPYCYTTKLSKTDCQSEVPTMLE
jgi:hypothetical protein